ncbi:FitA-like ribbon-helix-helix domain-containing protein [Nocardia sp. SSK8]|uniref:FitA-like ribbon-helix-helix domain-containing protein n=1 Tax=Nocardia sp. SSK8 TaxID=3120154 RepID=UPI003FA5A96B
MARLTVRDLPDDVRDRLRLRAAANGRSTEAEVRAILTDAVTPEPDENIKLGSLLAEIGREFELTDDEYDLINDRDRAPAEPLEFE